MGIRLNSDTIKFIQEHQKEDVCALALQASKYPLVDMSVAITQIAGLQTAKDKLPSWYATDGLLYPRHLSLEQCSSEMTARYKSSLLKGGSLIDLTGGFGIDCAFLAPNFKKVIYVEKQEELCGIAAHNFPLLGLNHVEIVNGDGVDFLKSTNRVNCIFIDPARRDDKGGKTVAISDCMPDVKAMSSLLLDKADMIMIKLSPMLDLALALSDMPETKAVHIVSVLNECKELLLVLASNDTESCKIHCVNLGRKGDMQCFDFTREEEQNVICDYASDMGKYLYEPNSSILKAGAYKSIAYKYGIKKLHPNSHLYTSDQLITDFPGRIFICHSAFSLNKREMKEHLSGISKANITVRNFPSSVSELRKRTKLNEGGEIYLFGTTLADEKRVILKCTKAI